MIRVAINGFGRIGKSFLRAYLQDQHAQSLMKIVAINIGPMKKEWVAHLFKHDTFMGIFPGKVDYRDGMLMLQNYEIPLLSQTDPAQLDWQALSVDWVVDASGKFTDRKGAMLHIKSGARKVLITAIAQQPDVTIVFGVNDHLYDVQKHEIISLASCTATAFFPILKVLHEACHVESVMMNVIHSYTNRQILMDIESSSIRRSRATGINIIPTDLLEPLCTPSVYPEYQGPIIGQGTRVPVPKVSLLDIAVCMRKKLDIEQLNDIFVKASDGKMKGVLEITNQPLVSCDFMNNAASVTIDQSLTSASGSMCKVFGWFDNEAGYAHRLKDFLVKYG